MPNGHKKLFYVLWKRICLEISVKNLVKQWICNELLTKGTVVELHKLRGPTLQKILYEISKSIDFIEITMISCDFSDFKDFIKCINTLLNQFLKDKLGISP